MLRNESCRGPLSVSPSSRIAFPNSMVEALSFAWPLDHPGRLPVDLGQVPVQREDVPVPGFEAVSL